jgi:hypothetical protein
LTAMDKRAETSEKYLRWIAKMIRCKKRKRGGSDDYNDESSDDNE